MLKNFVLLGTVSLSLMMAGGLDVPRKLTKEELIVEIERIEDIVVRYQPKLEKYQEYAEELIGTEPFSEECIRAVNIYGGFLLGMHNMRGRLARLKKELEKYAHDYHR